MNSRPLRFAVLSAVVALLCCLAGCTGPERAPESSAVDTPTAELSEEDVESWLDGLLPAALEREGIVGATVSVVADGRIIAAKGYGHVDAREDDARTVQAGSSLFRIGSISKLFTATIIMQLVEAESTGSRCSRARSHRLPVGHELR